jgi:hypothetical protein
LPAERFAWPAVEAGGDRGEVFGAMHGQVANAASASGRSTMCTLPVAPSPSGVSVGPRAIILSAYPSMNAQCSSAISTQIPDIRLVTAVEEVLHSA